jgi:Resolvase, N terminal domain
MLCPHASLGCKLMPVSHLTCVSELYNTKRLQRSRVYLGSDSKLNKRQSAVHYCQTRPACRTVHFISTLMEDKVDFVVLDFPQANRLTIHILSAVAEHEATMISARTKAVLQAAKARGIELGGDRSGGLSLHSAKGAATASDSHRKRTKAARGCQAGHSLDLRYWHFDVG